MTALIAFSCRFSPDICWCCVYGGDFVPHASPLCRNRSPASPQMPSVYGRDEGRGAYSPHLLVDC